MLRCTECDQNRNECTGDVPRMPDWHETRPGAAWTRLCQALSRCQGHEEEQPGMMMEQLEAPVGPPRDAPVEAPVEATAERPQEKGALPQPHPVAGPPMRWQDHRCLAPHALLEKQLCDDRRRHRWLEAASDRSTGIVCRRS